MQILYRTFLIFFLFSALTQCKAAKTYEDNSELNRLNNIKNRSLKWSSLTTAPITCLGQDSFSDCNASDWAHPMPGSRITEGVFVRRSKLHKGTDLAYAARGTLKMSNEDKKSVKEFPTLIKDMPTLQSMKDEGGYGVSSAVLLQKNTNGSEVAAIEQGIIVYSQANISSTGNWIIIGSRLPAQWILTKWQRHKLKALSLKNKRITFSEEMQTASDFNSANPNQMILLTHTYMHLNKRFLKKPGEVIHKGEIIGLSGKTGGPYAPHLHLEVQFEIALKGKNGITFESLDEFIDPFDIQHPLKHPSTMSKTQTMRRACRKIGAMAGLNNYVEEVSNYKSSKNPKISIEVFESDTSFTNTPLVEQQQTFKAALEETGSLDKSNIRRNIIDLDLNPICYQMDLIKPASDLNTLTNQIEETFCDTESTPCRLKSYNIINSPIEVRSAPQANPKTYCGKIDYVGERVWVSRKSGNWYKITLDETQQSQYLIKKCRSTWIHKTAFKKQL